MRSSGVRSSLVAMSVFDLIGLRAPCVETLHRLVAPAGASWESCAGRSAGSLPHKETNRQSLRPQHRPPNSHKKSHRSATSTAPPGTSGMARSWCTPRSQCSWKSPSALHAARIATTSACAVGSLVEVTWFTPVGNRSAVTHHHRAKWPPATRSYILRGQRDRLLHEVRIAFDDRPPCRPRACGMRLAISRQPQPINPYTCISL